MVPEDISVRQREVGTGWRQVTILYIQVLGLVSSLEGGADVL